MREQFKLAAKQLGTHFAKSEDGAITVDWIVLTAAIVGLAGLSGAMVLSATETVAQNIDDGLSTKTVETNI